MLLFVDWYCEEWDKLPFSCFSAVGVKLKGCQQLKGGFHFQYKHWKMESLQLKSAKKVSLLQKFNFMKSCQSLYKCPCSGHSKEACLEDTLKSLSGLGTSQCYLLTLVPLRTMSSDTAQWCFKLSCISKVSQESPHHPTDEVWTDTARRFTVQPQ